MKVEMQLIHLVLPMLLHQLLQLPQLMELLQQPQLMELLQLPQLTYHQNQTQLQQGLLRLSLNKQVMPHKEQIQRNNPTPLKLPTPQRLPMPTAPRQKPNQQPQPTPPNQRSQLIIRKTIFTCQSHRNNLQSHPMALPRSQRRRKRRTGQRLQTPLRLPLTRLRPRHQSIMLR